MTITQTGRRVALVGLLALIGALLPFTGASAIDGDEALELSGDSNTAVSIANSEVVYTPLGEDGPDNPPTNVLIGREDVFADNLASGSLQGAAAEGDNGAPLLLTGSDELDADVQAEIERLGATSVTILGGTAAISEDVETALGEIEGVDSVERLEGATRTETAIAVAGASGADTALLVRSGAAGDDATQAFADSLGAGALAATNGYSILFTQTEVLTGSTAEFLASDDAPSSVIIVGGTAAISEDTEAEVVEILGEDAVSRVSGPTRFDTAVALNGLRDGELGSYAVAVDGQGDDAWADGFSMANLSGLNNAPLVLTNQGEVPEATETYLESINDNDARAHLTNVFVVCGSTAAGDACDALAEAFGLTVVPWPPVAPPVDENSGVVVSTTGDAPDYSFVSEGADSVTTVTTEASDNFTVDGAAATSGVFFAALQPGDMVTYTEGDPATHALVNVDPDDILSGTVGNVNGTTFDIIEPVSGVTLNDNGGAHFDHAGGDIINMFDGATTTSAIVTLNLNEGDTVEITENSSAPDEFSFTNQMVMGTMSIALTNIADIGITIGGLGDDFAGNDYFYADGSANENFTIGGEESDFNEWKNQASEGDTATYYYEDGDEFFDLVNVAPPLVEGVITAGSMIPAAVAGDGGTVSILLPDGSTQTFTYDTTDTIIYDGLVTQELAFETALNAGEATPGDNVSYQPADEATSTSGVLQYDNDVAEGFVEDFTTGAPATIDLVQEADATANEGDELIQDGAIDDLLGTGGTYRYFDATGDSTVEVDEDVFANRVEEAYDDGDGAAYLVIDDSPTLAVSVTLYSEAPAA